MGISQWAHWTVRERLERHRLRLGNERVELRLGDVLRFVRGQGRFEHRFGAQREQRIGDRQRFERLVRQQRIEWQYGRRSRKCRRRWWLGKQRTRGWQLWRRRKLRLAARGAPGRGTQTIDAATGGTTDDGRAGDSGERSPESGVQVDSGDNAFTCNLLVGPSPLGQWFQRRILNLPWHRLHQVGSHRQIRKLHSRVVAVGRGDLEHAARRHATMREKLRRCQTRDLSRHPVGAMPVATWEMHFSGIIKNIKMKWPSVKRIELMLSTVGPGNMPCPGGGNEQFVQAAGLTALDAMPAQFPGLVFEDPAPGKWWIIPNCSDFNGPNPNTRTRAPPTWPR